MYLFHTPLMTKMDLLKTKQNSKRKPSLFLEIVALQKTASLYDRLLQQYLKKHYGCKTLESREIVIQLIKFDIEDKDMQARQMLNTFRRNNYKDGHRNYYTKQSESDSISS